ncbi:hypothetical protein [Aquimarina sp. RZ0]|uniref:hypothetical protein n=1 Tax=Aquimarina sp. RZ0 TaxID=2607730 RepID=UPI001CB72361|nr:hypothetical protein [Aquimarina sp. RZ0]
MHKQNGECNPDTLYEIIEIISPEIIFEELSLANFDEAYNAKTLITLETTAIKKYLKSNNIKNFPVDTYDLPDHYYDNLDHMFSELLYSSIFQESNELRYLLEKQSSFIRSGGFAFLNSDKNTEIFEGMDILKEKLLKKINNEKLYNIAKLEKEVIRKRENEILNTIYNYSEKHTYKQALLFIGSGHRKTIMDKIEKRKKKEENKVNWIFSLP